jgi:ketosteroid isomerase-like protein
MRCLAFSVFASAAVVISCQPAPTQLTDAERSSITERIGTLLEAFWTDWRNADYDAGMSHYLDSPETVFTGSGVLIHGYDTLHDAFRPAFAAVSSQQFDLENTDIVVLAHDAVQVSQSGTYSQTDTAGVSGPTRPFSFSTTWVLRDGEWKIIACHQSERTPPPEQ